MSDSPPFLYFAYGSNMLTRRLRARTPSARVVGLAALAGHELRWHKVSRDGSAKCDIVPSTVPASTVLGVVFEIEEKDRLALDAAEGLGKGYRELFVEVQADMGLLSARTYRATNIDRLALPFTWYKALVIAGAKEHNFPGPYVRALEAVPSKPDRDQEREAANLLLVGAN